MKQPWKMALGFAVLAFAVSPHGAHAAEPIKVSRLGWVSGCWEARSTRRLVE